MRAKAHNDKGIENANKIDKPVTETANIEKINNSRINTADIVEVDNPGIGIANTDKSSNPSIKIADINKVDDPGTGIVDANKRYKLGKSIANANMGDDLVTSIVQITNKVDYITKDKDNVNNSYLSKADAIEDVNNEIDEIYKC